MSGMDASRWRQIRELFDELAGEPAAQWAEQLQARCPGDPDLQRDVLAMLQADADEQTGPVVALSASAPALLDDLVKDHEARALNEWIGRTLGAWRITALIGSGGMGLVYLAERIDGNFEQQAAIKVMRAGADTATVMRRFREERQILAGLAHPNIARLLDGGVDAQGVPWFAMEYVDGQPITEWSAARNLDVRAKLALFLDVCAAMAHAHQHLVVHRDLKPQNVLVDTAGNAKLLDFGIAKLLDDADGSDRTGTAMRLMTPDYAAPEQIRGDPVTTAVDVYALGLLLFELLTGERPYRRKKHGTTLSTVTAVLHEEPLAPSAAVSRREAVPFTSATGSGSGSAGPSASGSMTSSASGSTPDAGSATSGSTTGTAPADSRRLRQQLRGDLDAIVLKALRKEPERRYRSVAEFATDVRAHLELRPVTARQGNRRYRVARFVRRHAGAAAFASLALLALVAGLAGTLRYAQLAQQERTVAVSEARKARTTAEFLRQLFVSTNPAATDGEDPRASELLDRGQRELMQRSDLDPATRASLLMEIAKALLSLDRFKQAQLAAEDATREAARSNDTGIRIRSHLSLGSALVAMRRHDEAVAEFTRSRVLYEQGEAEDPALDAEIDAHAAVASINLDRSEESIALLDSAFEKAGSTGSYADIHLDMLQVYVISLSRVGRTPQAVSIALRAYEQSKRSPRISLRQAATVASAYGHALLRAKRPAEAEQPFREALELRERIYGRGHRSTGGALHNLAVSLRDQEKFAEAVPYALASFELERTELGDDHPRVHSAMVSAGIILSNAGRHQEALLLLRDPMANGTWLEDAIDRTIIYGFLALVKSLRATGQHVQALQAAASGLAYEAENLAGGDLLPKWAALRLDRAELETLLDDQPSEESCNFLADPANMAQLDESERQRAARLGRRC